LLQPIMQSDTPLLDIAKYDGDWYVVVGSSAQPNSDIYINPLQNSANTDEKGALQSQLSLQQSSTRFVSFSDNARFIALQNQSAFTVYDAEVKAIYTFASPVALPSEGAEWLDGHRLHAVSDNVEQVFEYDGANYQKLVSATNGYSVFYDRDYRDAYSLVTDPAGGYKLQIGKLVSN